MSKLAIFLCAALIASVVNASSVSDTLVSAEAKFEGLIEATVNVTQAKFDDIKSRAVNHIAQLEVDAKAASKEVSEEIKSALEKARADIQKLTGEDKSVDSTECNKFASDLEAFGLGIIANMSACIDDKLATGNGYVQNINRISENVLANLTTIRDEARHCSDNVDGVKAAASAIACTNVAALKTAWVETKAVPSLIVEVTKIRYLIFTLQPSLIYCRLSNGIVSYYQEARIIATKTRQCVRQKKREARPTTEKAAESTTIPTKAEPEKVTEKVAV